MITDDLSIESKYIKDLISIKAPVSVYLKNSTRLRGYLIAQDDKCIYLKAEGTQMIYKHRISTIEPQTSFFNLLDSKKHLDFLRE